MLLNQNTLHPAVRYHHTRQIFLINISTEKEAKSAQSYKT